LEDLELSEEDLQGPGDSVLEEDDGLLLPVDDKAESKPSTGGGYDSGDFSLDKADDSASAQLLAKPVSELNLSVRAMNCLESEDIQTIGELIKKTSGNLLKIRNLGPTTLNEIGDKLAMLGLKLKGD